MNSFLKRSLSGILYVGVVVAAVYSGVWYLLGLLLIIQVLGQYEFFRLFNVEWDYWMLGNSILVGILLLFTIGLVVMDMEAYYVFWYILPLVILPPIFKILQGANANLKGLGIFFLSILYVVAPLTCFFWLVHWSGDYIENLAMMVFILIWTYDVFAYLAGSLIGKHQLHANLSPKKTWEGTILGVAATLIIAGYLHRYTILFTFEEWMGFALLLTITANFGDLLESMFKRKANLKDAGSIFPGHGGILDRFDTFIFIQPWLLGYMGIVLG